MSKLVRSLDQIRSFTIKTVTGLELKVVANQFVPWKFIIESSVSGREETVAYMCCTKPMLTANGCLEASYEVSNDEYDRLVEKYKVYKENPLSMFEGFVDYSEHKPEGGTNGQDPVQEH